MITQPNDDSVAERRRPALNSARVNSVLAAVVTTFVIVFFISGQLPLINAAPVSLPTEALKANSLELPAIGVASIVVEDTAAMTAANAAGTKTAARRADSEKLRRGLSNFINQWQTAQLVLAGEVTTTTTSSMLQDVRSVQNQNSNPTTVSLPKQQQLAASIEPVMIVASGDNVAASRSPTRLLGGPLRWG